MPLSKLDTLLLIVLILAADSIAQDIPFSLGEPQVISNPGVPIYPWFPDGHISLVQDGDQKQMYWAGSTSYRTLGRDVPTMKKPVLAVLSKGVAGECDNGGAWLMSVFRQTDRELIGFYHAEDHEFSGDPSSKEVAWKSIALCSSSDNGVTWTKKGQIITSFKPKPEKPTWGGNGDCCVVWDSANARWFCFYQEHYLMTAVSNDPNGAPGTWYKYYNGDFTEPGLGGENSPIPALIKHPGGNPSVHYNTHLQKWIMVWHTWEGHSPHPKSLWLSSSADLIDWTAPQPLVIAESQERIWYPTVIGASDVLADHSAYLYYAYWPDKDNWQRKFIGRSIQFGEPTKIQRNPVTINENCRLQPVYPNPFNSSARFSYTIGRADAVKLEIFDINGRKITTLVNEYQAADHYQLHFHADHLPGGVYIARLTVGSSFIQTERLLLLK